MVELFGGAILTMLAGTSAYAQLNIDPTGRSGEPPAPLKKEFKPPTPVPLPTLPIIPVPPEGEVKKPLGQIQVFATSIHVTGNTAFSDAELATVTAPYTNRTLTTEDLERLRLELTLLYVNKGYITSGTIIPDQDVTNGVINLQIVEGALAAGSMSRGTTCSVPVTCAPGRTGRADAATDGTAARTIAVTPARSAHRTDQRRASPRRHTRRQHLAGERERG